MESEGKITTLCADMAQGISEIMIELRDIRIRQQSKSTRPCYSQRYKYRPRFQPPLLCFYCLAAEHKVADCGAFIMAKAAKYPTRSDNYKQASDVVQWTYQQPLSERQTEIAQSRIVNALDVQKERDELENVKRKFERQMKDLETKLEVQTRELICGFDEAMQCREQEFQVQQDNLSNRIRAAELKTKRLETEVEVLTRGHQDIKCKFTKMKENNRHLERLLKEKTSELKATTVIKVRIQELESNLEKVELTMKKTQIDFERKSKEWETHCQEQDMAANAIREARDDVNWNFTNRLYDLQEQLNAKEIDRCNMEWNQQEMLTGKDPVISKLQDEVDSVRSGWERHIAELSELTGHEDVQLQTMMIKIDTMKFQLEQEKYTDRYKDLGESIQLESNDVISAAMLRDMENLREQNEKVNKLRRREDAMETETIAVGLDL